MEIEILREFFPFLETDLLQEMAACMTFRTFAPGQVMVRSAEPDENVFFAVSGIVKGIYTTPAGAEYLECLMEAPGVTFGSTTLSPGVLADYTLVAANEVTAGIMRKSDAEAFVQRSTELSMHVHKLLARAAAHHRQLHLATVTMDAASRYQWFVETYPKAAAVLKQYEIASLLGVTPEHLSHAIHASAKRKN